MNLFAALTRNTSVRQLMLQSFVFFLRWSLERVEELAARGGGRIGRTRAADEDDAGGEGVSPTADITSCRVQSASARYR